MPPVMFIELNEIDFDLLHKYVDRGDLPNFERFFQRHGYVQTLSEDRHEHVNPWIQWPTAHTGLEFAEHGIFRMGDMYYADHEQIWERLESHGLKVGAISPFNATNKTKRAAFFMPDPWMRSAVTGPRALRWIYEAILQVTDDYANERIAAGSLARLAAGAAVCMQWRSLPSYVHDTLAYFGKRGRWYRALVADRLLADLFIWLWRRDRPDFASLCLNAGAHLQHHYLFCSPFYRGPLRNPSWWSKEGDDPVLDAYRLYDRILGDLQRADPNARIVLCTGLHQQAHDREAHYYRLEEHERVFEALGIPYRNIHPLMTEDFVVEYDDEAAALEGQRRIEEVVASEPDVFYLNTGDTDLRGTSTAPQVFYVDNRGATLYVQLKPTARRLPPDLSVSRDDRRIERFASQVAYAQLKNGHHAGVGYFSDSGVRAGQLPAPFRLAQVFPMILRMFGLDPAVRRPHSHGAPQPAAEPAQAHELV
ncbi:MAG TPA: hypothetical protein VM491_19945 [Burkholderiaceae bacterium]|nr:hypothetical protein [Burkholderiaceae bacterium]